MKFTLYDHAGKGQHLRQALLDAGHEEAGSIDELELLLVDHDGPWAHPRPAMIQTASEYGAKVALYPHGGRPDVFKYDGICEPNPLVGLRLEHGVGSLEMAPPGQMLHQEAVGWLFSITRNFHPIEKPKRVLFAPLHANIEMIQRGILNGHDPAPALNQPIYRQLLEMRGIDLDVSVSGPLWRTGIWQHPRARIIENPQMRFEHSLKLIDQADVVVAAGTMAATAVARGKPTVMFDQDIFADYVDGEYREAGRSELFREMVRYPLDASDGTLSDLIAAACEREQTEWRDRWVGTDGTTRAVELLERLLRPREPRESDVVIQGATARATST